MEGKVFPGLTEDEITKIISNPFYAIDFDKNLIADHPKIVTEEQWIKGKSN